MNYFNQEHNFLFYFFIYFQTPIYLDNASSECTDITKISICIMKKVECLYYMYF